MTQVRADLLLVQRGLISTRAKAREAIEAGLVRTDGRLVKKPSESLSVDCNLKAQPAYPWVSRAGLKLVGALDTFGVSAQGRHCLDIGASTGGFTQVLLAHGASHVIAVDVGRGQLDQTLGADPRITSLEGQDARGLTEDQLGDQKPDLIVMDVSFIGIEKILPHVLLLMPERFDLIALIKPQFQAGPQRVGKGGLVDPKIAEVIANEVQQDIEVLGLKVMATIESPILGGDGNREFLMWAQRGV